MHRPPVHARRRIAIAGFAAALLIAGEHRPPLVDRISISVDDHLAARVDADWSPPVAQAINGATRAAATVAAALPR